MARLSPCKTARAQLSRRLDETLSPEEAARLESHLDRCAPCRRHDAQLTAMRDALRHLPRPPDSDAARTRTFARFDARTRPRSLHAALSRPAVRVAVALAAAAASLLIPLQPVEAPLPDPGEISALHTLHTTHAPLLAGLPEGASAEAAPEMK